MTLPRDVVGMSGEVFEDPSPLCSEADVSDLLCSFPLLFDPQNRTICGLLREARKCWWCGDKALNARATGVTCILPAIAALDIWYVIRVGLDEFHWQPLRKPCPLS